MTNGEPRRGLEGQAEEAGRRLARVIALAFGVVMHLMMGAVYAMSGLLAPGWAVLLLWGLWIVLAALMWRQRHRVWALLAIPCAAAAVWGVAMWLGDTFLGWTA